jgi:hypothetical protein
VKEFASNFATNIDHWPAEKKKIVFLRILKETGGLIDSMFRNH